MKQFEKVTQGLACLAGENEMKSNPCAVCGYSDCQVYSICIGTVAKDALSLARTQQERIKELETGKAARTMPLEDIRMQEVVWIEQEDVSRPWPTAMHHIRRAGLSSGPVYQDYIGEDWNAKEYGKKWRCWTSRPTDEQRKAVKWVAEHEA